MRGILFASFGTTHEAAAHGGIDGVADLIGERMPDCRVKQAYTSGMVRRVLQKRGISVPDVAEALDKMAESGVDEVIIQPGHLMPGEEYAKLVSQAESRRSLFGRMRIGEPLFGRTEDIHRVADILHEAYPVQDGLCTVLMGHGTPQFANTVYPALQYRFYEMGRRDIFVGTVEAYPSLDTVMKLIPEGKYHKVRLLPLMQVAGDHAVNDMAGDDSESWRSRFELAGYETACILHGLGEMQAIREMYLEHIEQA